MRIVVLDGLPLNPGDLSWAALEGLGECSIFERTGSDEVVERSAGAEILLTNKTTLDRLTISRLDSVKYVGILATGYNTVDVGAATAKGIVVTNVPTYATDSVAQMVFAHILNLASGIAYHAQSVREGRWSSSKDWSYWERELIELSGLTLGVIGYGRIGTAVGLLAQSFGMKVIAFEPDPGRKARDRGISFVPLNDLFRSSDIVSLHCPLTDQTRGLVNEKRLAMMKSSAILVNTSRGQLIDEAALADALNAGVIAGAGLDVLSVEPPASSNILFHARNCVITPHIAWATHAARRRLLDAAVANLEAFLVGTPINVVSS